MARTPSPRSGPAALPTTFPAPAGAVAAAARARGAADVPTQRGRRRPAPAPVPLGSLLTAAPGRDRAGCPRCGGASVTRLAMTLPDGAPATFVSCHTCETTGWYAADGAPLGLDAVLGSAARA